MGETIAYVNSQLDIVKKWRAICYNAIENKKGRHEDELKLKKTHFATILRLYVLRAWTICVKNIKVELRSRHMDLKTWASSLPWAMCYIYLQQCVLSWAM